MDLLKLKGCPRCRGTVCHRCESVHKAGHCLQCGNVLYEVSEAIQAEFNARLGKVFMIRQGRVAGSLDKSVELGEEASVAGS